MSPETSIREERASAGMALAAAAAAGERRNRSTALIAGAGVLLAGACVYTLLAYQSLSHARERIALERDQTRVIADLSTQIARVTREERELIFEPDTGVAAALENLAREVGIADPVLIDQRAQTAVTGLQGVVSKTYNPKQPLRSVEIGPLLTWLARASDGSVVPGLSPRNVTIRALRTGPTDRPAGPGEADWEMNVSFTRIERAG